MSQMIGSGGCGEEFYFKGGSARLDQLLQQESAWLCVDALPATGNAENSPIVQPRDAPFFRSKLRVIVGSDAAV